MCVIEALMPAEWLKNNFNTIQTTNTFENRKVTRHNLRILASIFSAYNQLKNNNISPQNKEIVYFTQHILFWYEGHITRKETNPTDVFFD